MLKHSQEGHSVYNKQAKNILMECRFERQLSSNTKLFQKNKVSSNVKSKGKMVKQMDAGLQACFASMINLMTLIVQRHILLRITLKLLQRKAGEI